MSETIVGGPRIADNALAELVVKASTRKPDVTRVDFEQLLDRWLDLKEDRLSAKSNYNNRWLAKKYLFDALGDKHISALTAAHVDGFYSSLKESGLSPYIIRQIHAIIRSCLNQAMK